MTKKEFENIKRGDIVRHINDADSLVVGDVRTSYSTYDEGRVTLILVRVTVTEATNPAEWQKVG